LYALLCLGTGDLVKDKQEFRLFRNERRGENYVRYEMG
jgi:hypothetical protein